MEARALRERGNEAFKAGRYDDAKAAYSEAVAALQREHGLRPGAAQVPPAAAPELVLALSNRAACSLKLGAIEDAIHDTSAVLQLDGGNLKALYRRATALRAAGRTPEAVADVRKLLHIDPSNKEGAELLRGLMVQAQGSGAGRGTGYVGASAGGASSATAAAPPAAASGGAPATLVDFIDAVAGVEAGRTQLAWGPAIAKLPALLEGGHQLRAFLTSPAPHQLLAAAPPDLLGKAVVIVSNAYGRAANEFGAGWGREWASAAEAAPTPDTVAWHASQLAFMTTAAKVLKAQYLPLLGRAMGSGVEGIPLLRAAVMGSTAAIAVSLAVARPQLASLHDKAMQAAKEHVKGAQKKQSAKQRESAAAAAATAEAQGGDGGAASAARKAAPRIVTTVEAAFSRAQIPEPLRGATVAWCGAMRELMDAPPGDALPATLATSLPGGPYFRQVAAVGALATVMDIEDAVWAAGESGVLASVLNFAVALGRRGGDGDDDGSSRSASHKKKTAEEEEGATRLRRGVAALFTRALTVLREACARGYAETGRAKQRRLLSYLVSGVIDDLASALPFSPEYVAAVGDGVKGAPDLIKAAQAAAAASAAKGAEGGSAAAAALAPLTAPPDWAPEEGRARVARLLDVALQVDRDTGLWLADQPGVLPAVFVSSAAPFAPWQEAAADATAALCSDETGRSMLSTLSDRLDGDRIGAVDPTFRLRLDVLGLLRRLSDSPFEHVRASASVSLAKLTAPSKAFGERLPAGGGGGAPAPGAAAAAAAGAAAAAALPGAAAGARQGTEVIASTINQLRAAANLAPVSAKALAAALPPAAGAPSFSALYKSARLAAAGSKPPKGAPVVDVDLAAAANAVEALAVLANNVATKDAVVTEPCVEALLHIAAACCVRMQAAAKAAALRAGDADLAQLGSDGGASSLSSAAARPAAYGIAFVLKCIFSSRARMQEEKLAEMGIDREQWAKLQAMTSPNAAATAELAPEARALLESGGGGGIAPADEDTMADVQARVKALVRYDVLSLICALSEAVSLEGKAIAQLAAASGGGGGDAPPDAAAGTASGTAVAGIKGANTRSTLSWVLCAMAEFQEVRGAMIQAGCMPVLIALGGDTDAASQTTDGALCAAQALARLLITTRPDLLPPAAAADAVPILLRLLRDSSATLQLFEGCLAITNLGSSAPATRAALLKRHALQALEYCQFHDDVRLRRAGTEGIVNLASTDAGARMILGGRLSLWLALAQNYKRPGAEAEAEAAVAEVRAAAAAKSSAGAKKDDAFAALQQARRERAARLAAEGDADTATASAAAGGLAMALQYVVSRGEGAEDPLAEPEQRAPPAARGRGGQALPLPAPAPASPTPAQLRTAARAAVYRLVDAGVVPVAADLLMSGDAGLIHRAIFIVAELAKYRRAAGALMASLTGPGGEGAAEGAALPLSCLSLLQLVAEGKDPGALAAAGVAGPSTSTALAPLGAEGSVPPPLRSLAATAVVRCLSHLQASRGGWKALLKVCQPRVPAGAALLDDAGNPLQEGDSSAAAQEGGGEEDTLSATVHGVKHEVTVSSEGDARLLAQPQRTTRVLPLVVPDAVVAAWLGAGRKTLRQLAAALGEEPEEAEAEATYVNSDSEDDDATA